ncbi:hypothetical protein CONPUDRAFT_69369 [Coniophora puteana RWD-64-598 SS2]|uniref:Homeobox domain-containing protein n=1 Tax=Coniophora puteana (strain RWD-64-598) TaxID=741705 RepID=A0A5M3N859_CONPW|nr:uncharacterized protein CONPUDRAFT_69369 [Coniophora puteana RWD-64-598 SS2]EIW87041.1 hypothetical protein CONPUDRAFT_69369 [Coniophora puteana RWD-64-598 SS2]
MEEDIRRRLLSAEEQLLSALSADHHNLASYEQVWSSLGNDLASAIASNAVDSDVLHLAHTVASHIFDLSIYIQELQHSEEDTVQRIRCDQESIMEDFCHLSISSPEPPSIASSQLTGPSRPSALEHESTFPFIAPALDWLLCNLHNPYPSPETRRTIAYTSSSPLDSVNDWFKNVRKRIGWTAILQNHFKGYKRDALVAAHRVLVDDDGDTSSNAPVPPNIAFDFVQMKVAAESLYETKNPNSGLAGQLDNVVEGLRGRGNWGGETSGKRKRKAERESEPRKRRWPASKRYPTPYSSTSSSPVPALEHLLTDTDDEEVDSLPSPGQTIVSRHVSISSDYSEPTSPLNSLRAKKRRLDDGEVTPRVQSKVLEHIAMSPASSECSVISRSPSMQPSQPPSRKRCLSDVYHTRQTSSARADECPVTHRFRHSQSKQLFSDADTEEKPSKRVRPNDIVSRPQVTLKSPPLSTALDANYDWFSTPTAVCTTDLQDVSGPVDVRLFDYTTVSAVDPSSFDIFESSLSFTDGCVTNLDLTAISSDVQSPYGSQAFPVPQDFLDYFPNASEGCSSANEPTATSSSGRILLQAETQLSALESSGYKGPPNPGSSLSLNVLGSQGTFSQMVSEIGFSGLYEVYDAEKEAKLRRLYEHTVEMDRLRLELGLA